MLLAPWFSRRETDRKGKLCPAVALAKSFSRNMEGPARIVASQSLKGFRVQQLVSK